MRKLLVIFFILLSSFSFAQTVPKYLNYQAVLFDDGGNPLPDGSTKVHIRLLDANMAQIFEEDQVVDVKSGIVSIMVGSAAGGIDSTSLLPEGPKYLEVQAEGYSPEDLMEIASVPYSSVSDVAMNVADGAIKMSSLSDEVLKELGDKIVGGAGNVVVTPDFTYSSAENVQGVLRDLDLSIKKRAEEITRTATAIQNYVDQKVANITTTITTNNANIWNALSAHILNKNNPHNVTTAQIGAVATSILFNQNGQINDGLIPPNVARITDIIPVVNPPEPVPVAHVRVLCSGAANGSGCAIQTADSSADCGLNTVVRENQPKELYIECVLARQSVPTGGRCDMEIKGEIVPTYRVQAGAGAVTANAYGYGMRRYISNIDADGSWDTFGCRDMVEFMISGGMSSGDDITITFYERLLF